MDEISKLRERMTVVAADGRIVGSVAAVGADGIRVKGVKDGRGFDRLIPVSWVAEVGKYAFLNKESGDLAPG